MINYLEKVFKQDKVNRNLGASRTATQENMANAAQPIGSAVVDPGFPRQGEC